MKWLNLKPDGRFMKAARVEGETMGKLHPNGGCYGAMVTQAQWWTNNNPLVDGHGNWGSLTDGAAAPRYTEAKLTEYAWNVLLQNADVWLTRPSYDGSFQEPTVLNAKVPTFWSMAAKALLLVLQLKSQLTTFVALLKHFAA